MIQEKAIEELSPPQTDPLVRMTKIFTFSRQL